jgi:hypothetical protein
MSDFRQELGGWAGTEAAEMDRAALQAELVERIEVNHCCASGWRTPGVCFAIRTGFV